VNAQAVKTVPVLQKKEGVPVNNQIQNRKDINGGRL
jgi:hypothetical protein